MFIKQKFEKEVKVKGKDKPEVRQFVEVQKPDGDTIIKEILADGYTKSEGIDKLLRFEKRAEEAKKKAKAKSKSKAKAKAK